MSAVKVISAMPQVFGPYRLDAALAPKAPVTDDPFEGQFYAQLPVGAIVTHCWMVVVEDFVPEDATGQSLEYKIQAERWGQIYASRLLNPDGSLYEVDGVVVSDGFIRASDVPVLSSATAFVSTGDPLHYYVGVDNGQEGLGWVSGKADLYFLLARFDS